MAINATSNGTTRELIPAGNYLARCFQMIEIGQVTDLIMGEQKTQAKVRIGWELPTELKVFREEKGEQPLVISQEYTLSMHEKSNLRKILASWRGQDFTESEARSFDITKLLGVPCMLNIIHKPSKADPTRVYEQIASISPIPKGVKAPPAINPVFVLSYDNFDEGLFNSLPDFIKTRMQGSAEYMAMKSPNSKVMDAEHITEPIDDLPF